MMTLSAIPPKPETTGKEDLRQTSRPAYLLKRSDQLISAMYLKHGRADNSKLTFSQLLLLCASQDKPGLHQAVAARMAGMDSPTSTVVIRSLVRNGHIERSTSEHDRRQMLLSVTSAGRSAIKLGLRHLALAQQGFLESITEQDQQRLLQLLKAISTNTQANASPLCDLRGEPVVIPEYLPEQVQIAFLFSRCLQVAVSLVNPALTPFGLSIGQYVSLFVLTTHEGCNLSTLSRTMGRKRSSLSLILSSLESRALIQISQQGRALEISSTAAGLDLFQRAQPVAEEANSHILSELDDSQVEDFVRILRLALDAKGILIQQ